MKPYSDLQLQIIQLLDGGVAYRGTVLGKMLGTSRHAICQAIDDLIELGLPIQCFPQLGYCFTSPLLLINEQKILKQLQSCRFRTSIHFHWFPIIDSTNQFLKTLAPSGSLALCCAEMQTRGRGRFNRHWISPFGENIYCSILCNLRASLSQLSSISLVIGLALLSSLKDSHIEEKILLKWPNDLLWKDKKLAGILIESQGEEQGYTKLIIGIGLNVNTPTQLDPLADKPWCSLFEITGKTFDRNFLLANLINCLQKYLEKFVQQGFSAFLQEWEAVNYLAGKVIEIIQARETVQGTVRGLNALGHLGLEVELGKIRYFASGDASLSQW